MFKIPFGPLWMHRPEMALQYRIFNSSQSEISSNRILNVKIKFQNLTFTFRPFQNFQYYWVVSSFEEKREINPLDGQQWMENSLPGCKTP